MVETQVRRSLRVAALTPSKFNYPDENMHENLWLASTPLKSPSDTPRKRRQRKLMEEAAEADAALLTPRRSSRLLLKAGMNYDVPKTTATSSVFIERGGKSILAQYNPILFVWRCVAAVIVFLFDLMRKVGMAGFWAVKRIPSMRMPSIRARKPLMPFKFTLLKPLFRVSLLIGIALLVSQVVRFFTPSNSAVLDSVDLKRILKENEFKSSTEASTDSGIIKALQQKMDILENSVLLAMQKIESLDKSSELKGIWEKKLDEFKREISIEAIEAKILEKIPSSDSSFVKVKNGKLEVDSRLQAYLSSLIKSHNSDVDIAKLLSEKRFVEKDELLSILDSQTRGLLNKELSLVSSKVAEMEKKLKDFTSHSLVDDLLIKISENVTMALEKYSADKLAVADYALFSVGGRVISEMTSPTYFESFDNPLARLLSIGIHGKPPIVALSADNSLGNCWSFNGSEGKLTISLSQPVIPTDFTIEHVPKSIAIDVSSAPKQVSVWGLESENSERNAKILANYTFNSDASSIQSFVGNKGNQSYRFIQLRIHSNHGNPKFTCLYRFRVHSIV